MLGEYGETVLVADRHGDHKIMGEVEMNHIVRYLEQACRGKRKLMINARSGPAAVLAASILLVAGCNSASPGTISKEEFQKIEMSMTEDQVRAVAGEPSGQSGKRREGSPTRSYSQREWYYNSRDVLVMFRNGKVVFKHHKEWGEESNYE